MRPITCPLAALAVVALAAPVVAQDNPVTLGYFLTVRTENLSDFEEAARQHNAWHASQNDPQTWVGYQAMTGHGEFAFVAPNMSWASMDAPAVDMATDVAQWAESGAEFVETEDVVMWTNVPGGNPPEDPTQYPVVQVYEFEINAGGQAAAMNVMQRANEALSKTSAHFQWSALVSQDGPPSVFLALWFQNFAELGTPGPSPDGIMADAFGPAQGARILRDFSEATTARSSQIWILRPDLSYFPGM